MRRSIQGVVLFASVAAVGAARGQEAVQWRVEDGGNGHWYQIQFDLTPVCWIHANACSRALGGHLVTLASFAENAFVVNSVVRPADPGTGEWGPYIGATAQGLPWGTWRWVTDEPWSFSGFEQGEPNSNGAEVHVHYRHWQYGLYWNDSFSCGMTRSFVIEWSSDCNADGIVDYGQCRDGTLADFDGNNVPDCCESGSTCVVGNYPVQWRASEGGNGHWYTNVSVGNVIGWFAAKAAAEAVGGYLACPTSQAENDWLWSSVVAPVYTGWDGWIGLYCTASSF